ncbi:hypothetical protein SYNPS1DRAFT_30778, partial [Syncephalis pseudoplumigaleata]
MWKPLLLIVMGVLVQCSCTAATIAVRGPHRLETFATYDPIKMDQNFSPITGIVLPIRFERKRRCRIRARTPHSYANKNFTFPPENPGFIVMENEAGQEYTGCKSFEDLENAIARYSRWLVKRKYFPIKAVMIKHWSLNNYFSDMYNGALSYVIDTRPANRIPIVLVTFDTFKRVHFLSRKKEVWVAGTLTHERSAWNAILLSSWYKAFLWLFFALNALFVVHGFGRIVFVSVYGAFRSELRTVAFAIAICSAI